MTQEEIAQAIWPQESASIKISFDKKSGEINMETNGKSLDIYKTIVCAFIDHEAVAEIFQQAANAAKKLTNG